LPTFLSTSPHGAEYYLRQKGLEAGGLDIRLVASERMETLQYVVTSTTNKQCFLHFAVLIYSSVLHHRQPYTLLGDALLALRMIMLEYVESLLRRLGA